MKRILLSNDDGVHAPGINELFKQFTPDHDTVMVAPSDERSTTGHSLSLDRPLRLDKIADNIYGCSGFPADCTMMGIGHVLKDRRPDIVVSGINRGANLGQDLYYSGTVAAAREAAFHDIPSLAVSLVLTAKEIEGDYIPSGQIISWLLKAHIEKTIPKLCLLNVNVPQGPLKKMKGIKLTTIGLRNYSEEVVPRLDSRGRDYYWIAGSYGGFRDLGETDCKAIADGYVSLTVHNLLNLEPPSLIELEKVIKSINETYFY